MGNWHQLLLFVIFGFVITWGGTFLINLIRVPAILHNEQLQTIAGLEREIRQLTKPKLDPVEESIRSQVRELFAKITQQDKEILKEAIVHGGKIVAGEPLKAIADKLKMNTTAMINGLHKLAQLHLLTYEQHPELRSNNLWWEVPAGYQNAFRELLWS